ncbi:MAG: ABC transporter permease subunit [Atopobiaceae bacterium]|nr:ABC transporter permease subunit [Atopobiaceae bacterium]
MGMLIHFELRKIVNNRAGMAACVAVLAMLVAVAVLNVVTLGVRDYDSGNYVHGFQAQRAIRARAARHAGTLTDERVAADASAFDRAIELWEAQPELADKGGWEASGDAAITLGLDFWRETGALFDDPYYDEVVGTLDSTNPRAASLEEGAAVRVDAALSQGFWDYFPYTDAEKAYWHNLEDGISWPMEYGYERGWHNVIRWKGFSGLATVALSIALSGVFAGEYQDGTVAVVLPTRHGKRMLPTVKVIASLVFATAYWTLLVAVVVGLHVGIYGAEGWGLPLQVSAGLDSPYPLTIGQTVLASYAIGYVVMLGMVGLTLLLSSVFRSAMPAAVVPMALVFLGIIMLFATPLAKIALLTPFSGLSYVYIYMASYAAGPLVADLPTVLAVLYALLLAVLTPLAMRAFRRHQVA